MDISVTVVGVVFNSDGKVLLVKERDGGWALPGGKVHPGERLDQALKREILEETGCLVDVVGLEKLYQVIDSEKTMIIAVFTCKLITREHSGNLPTRWCRIAELERLNLMYPETPMIIVSVIRKSKFWGLKEIGGQRFYFYI